MKMTDSAGIVGKNCKRPTPNPSHKGRGIYTELNINKNRNNKIMPHSLYINVSTPLPLWEG